jgi:hypothetical protein
MGLLPTDFKPPPTQVVQACALNTGHDGHDGQELNPGHLQRLLDEDEVTSNRPRTDLLR